MLSYMLPVEEKSPSAAAAAATRNLSLNLTTTTTTTASGGVGVGNGSGGGAGAAASAAGVAIGRDSSGGATAPSTSSAQVRSIIKPTIKHSGGGSAASHRYQLISGGSCGSDAKLVGDSGAPGGAAAATVGGGGGGRDVRSGRGRWQDEPEADQCDESTNLLAGAGADDDDEDDRDAIDDRPRRGAAVKSDKNFNNLIVVPNGRHGKPTNGNHAGPPAKLASVLKPTNGVGSNGRPGGSNGGGGTGGHTGAYYNGYLAVSGDNDDEHHRLLVSANNLRNASGDTRPDWSPQGRTNGCGPATTEPSGRPASSFASGARTNGNCRTMNSLNGNLLGSDPPAVAPLPLETTDIGDGGGGGTGGAADVSLGSDSDSATGAGGTGSATGGGSKKVKLNKLGGNKNVTLKRCRMMQHAAVRMGREEAFAKWAEKNEPIMAAVLKLRLAA
uniref:Uncharacterized protein n=1 Tax=Anopheles melas TaxID=34690 RepID=A0A182U017_9DIPT